jgi:outer membrane protein assembly factor BamB
MPGGNVISPACYSTENGKCLSVAVGNGSPRANRGEEIGVLGGDYLVFGGRLRYSGVPNYVNPGSFSIAKIGPGGIGRPVRIASGKIPPAWSSKILVMADGPRSVPMCVENADLIEYKGTAGPSDRPAQARHADPLQRKWTAQGLQTSDPVAFVIAKNTILAVMEVPRPRRLASAWQLVGLDPETGKVIWRNPLASAALPGGVLVNRHGQIIVVHEDGSISCLG